MEPKWLEWSRTLQAIAQNGLTFAQDPYDRARYTQIQKVAAEIMSSYSGTSFTQVLGLFEKEQGYATPKVDVRAAVFRNNEVLMVREQEDGCWSLPGGWADVREHPSAVAEREVMEESGYRARTTRVLAIYDRDLHKHPPLPFHVYKVFFLCELLDEHPAPNAECTEVGFFPLANLPKLSLSRVNEAEINRMFEYLHDPSLPADFD